MSSRPRREPRECARTVEQDLKLPGGDDERFAGYGVMGQPFRSGHYLAMRHFPATSVGPGYRALWHRGPTGRWTIYADVAPELSCARYFGLALDKAETSAVAVDWTGPRSLTVTVPDVVVWDIELVSTVATRLLSKVGARLPRRAWRSDAVLTAMAPMAGQILRAGRVGLLGRVPNGQQFQVNPRLLWEVETAGALWKGSDLGPCGPLPEQDRLGDFWLPQRGLFVVGEAFYETFDDTRHSDVTRGVLPMS
ncbi:MAG TPA: hypothetical protein VFJ19_15695 [Nocardioidaceae bacterium]|nr:hypothetical protein [Nocardioidaceae bacterium]